MLTLQRYGSTPMGTFGRLYAPGFSCHTVERPWMNNEPYISCVPAGEYTLRPWRWKNQLDTVELANVPGRSAILIHPANCAYQLQGCIAPGRFLGCVDGQWAVTDSRSTFNELAEVLAAVIRGDNPTATIRITDP